MAEPPNYERLKLEHGLALSPPSENLAPSEPAPVKTQAEREEAAFARDAAVLDRMAKRGESPADILYMQRRLENEPLDQKLRRTEAEAAYEKAAERGRAYLEGVRDKDKEPKRPKEKEDAEADVDRGPEKEIDVATARKEARIAEPSENVAPSEPAPIKTQAEREEAAFARDAAVLDRMAKRGESPADILYMQRRLENEPLDQKLRRTEAEAAYEKAAERARAYLEGVRDKNNEPKRPKEKEEAEADVDRGPEKEIDDATARKEARIAEYGARRAELRERHAARKQESGRGHGGRE